MHAVDSETSSGAILFGYMLADCAFENSDHHGDMHRFWNKM